MHILLILLLLAWIAPAALFAFYFIWRCIAERNWSGFGEAMIIALLWPVALPLISMGRGE